MPALQKALSDAAAMPALPLALPESGARSRCNSEPGNSQPGNSQPGNSDLARADRVRLTERIIQDYHESVYRYAFWLTGCGASAEDITQEVFTRAFRAIHSLRDAGAVKGWLMTITRNESTRWRNKQRPIPMGEG